MIDHPIRWFNHNEGFAIVFLTFVLSVITAGSVIVTVMMFGPAQRQRRDAMRPLIIFRGLSEVEKKSITDAFVIQLVNAGPGSAIDILAVIDPPSVRSFAVDAGQRFSTTATLTRRDRRSAG